MTRTATIQTSNNLHGVNHRTPGAHYPGHGPGHLAVASVPQDAASSEITHAWDLLRPGTAKELCEDDGHRCSYAIVLEPQETGRLIVEGPCTAGIALAQGLRSAGSGPPRRSRPTSPGSRPMAGAGGAVPTERPNGDLSRPCSFGCRPAATSGLDPAAAEELNREVECCVHRLPPWVDRRLRSARFQVTHRID